MDRQLYVDRILESENLTDELLDMDARWLLDWGIGQLDRALQDVSGEDEADEKVTALMGAMRKINRIAGGRESTNSDAMAADLAALATLFTQAFGHTPDIRQSGAAAKLRQGTTRQALEFLTGWGLQ